MTTRPPSRPDPDPEVRAAATEADDSASVSQPAPGWTLLTSHGRVFLLIARNPELRLRDMARLAQITERSAATIVRDLEQAGYLTKVRAGRRNRYIVHGDRAFRHPAEAQHRVRELIEIFTHE